jgi:hypothetical protein
MNIFPPWRGAALRRGGSLLVFNVYFEKRIKKYD